MRGVLSLSEVSLPTSSRPQSSLASHASLASELLTALDSEQLVSLPVDTLRMAVDSWVWVDTKSSLIFFVDCFFSVVRFWRSIYCLRTETLAFLPNPHRGVSPTPHPHGSSYPPFFLFCFTMLRYARWCMYFTTRFWSTEYFSEKTWMLLSFPCRLADKCVPIPVIK